MNKLIPLLFFCFSLTLTAQDFTITNFDINIEVDVDGALHVNETIDVYFSKQKRGIYRELESVFIINGGEINLDIKNINIEGHEYKIDKKKELVIIRIGSPDVFLTGNQQYNISYTIKNGIITYPEYQELLYDLTGNAWETKIENVNFSIKLPRSITLGENDLKVTGGRKGQNLNIADIRQVDSRTIKGKSLGRLHEYNGLTAAIRLPKNYLDVAQNNVTYYETPEEKEYKPWYLAIPIALLGFFMTFWNKMRRNEYDAVPDPLLVYPPDGLTSAHIGAFVDQTANTRDIVSLLPYWASEGYLEMKQIGEEIYLYKIKNLPPNFPEYEHVIFDKLFKENEVAKISDLKTKFHSSLQEALSLLTKEVKLQDYYNQEYISTFRGWKVVLFPFSMIALGLLSLIYFKLIFLGIGFFFVALAGIILPLFNLPLTKKGARLKAEIDSFKSFLRNPDEVVLEKVVKEDPTYFDKMFPFAIAFGLEEKFLKKLEPYMNSAPIWYQNDNSSRSFSTFRTGFKPEVIQSAFSSVPHNSSGSSSGGGSFSSGSGIGGGGGGSW